ncbi:MAG TPA: lactate racemase domain-containing protein, partial [Candidatus Bathyarchaeia archaeon]|nr:lactate racemase domain-containing protein [Candidatus Bathyarchaeia archaeon]
MHIDILKTRIRPRMGKSRLVLRYGDRETAVTLNERNVVQVVQPNELEAGDEKNEIIHAMDHPIGTYSLSEIVATRKASKKDSTAVIIVSDVTRPVPTKKLLPHVLREVHKGGIAKDSTTIMFALGIHRPLAEPEMKALVGDKVFSDYKCVNHRPNECAFVGTTSRGTPVSANTAVLDADVRICVGAVELHYFAGYSGGYKSLLPGICARGTIEANHKLMLKPNAAAGRLDSP